MEQKKIYSEVYQIDTDDFNDWLEENESIIDNKILEINPNIDISKCGYSANTFIGDDWDCYQGSLSQDDDIEKYKDEPFVVKKEAICRVFFEQYPECKDKSVILVRS